MAQIKKEKKFFFEEQDGIEQIFEKLESTVAEKIILNIPGKSVIGSSVENFHLIKQKARLLKKEIIIESVNDHILECASAADIVAVNPVFRTRERTFSDVVFRSSIKKIDEEKDVAASENISQKDNHEEKEGKRIENIFSKIQSQKKTGEKNIYDRYETKKEKQERGLNTKKYVFFIFIAIVLFGGVFSFFYLLPKVTAEINLKRVSKKFDERVVVSIKSTTPQIQDGKIILPGELLSANKNTTIEVKAQGKTKVEENAKGIITIYNSFDKNSQTLVATTRFESSDGKIVRLVKGVTVPGMVMKNGTLTPSSIDAEVIADKPGDSYNVPENTKWNIPGFKGTPRYSKFYAENKEKLSGGFSGERPQVTDADKKNSEDQIQKTLESALNGQMSILLSEKFLLLPGATRFIITKSTLQFVPTNPDKASLYGEAEMKKIVFIESMLQDALKSKFRAELSTSTSVESFVVSYSDPIINWNEGIMEFQATGSVIFVSNIQKDVFIKSIRRKNESELKNYILEFPEIESARVSFWPLWVKKVPENEKRIDVLIK